MQTRTATARWYTTHGVDITGGHAQARLREASLRDNVLLTMIETASKLRNCFFWVSGRGGGVFFVANGGGIAFGGVVWVGGFGGSLALAGRRRHSERAASA